MVRRVVIGVLLCGGLAWAQYWQRVPLPGQYDANYWLDVFFLPSNPQYGWICGFNGMVVRTTDGGRTWQGTQIPNAYQLESIHFVTPQVGYTSGPEGIWRSTDGGATWIQVTPQDTQQRAFWGTYFLSPTVGMVIGGGCGGTTQRFYRTTNGGATWSVFVGSEPNSGLTDVILYPDGSGIAVSSGRLWRTSDSGQTWEVFATTGSAVWQEELTHVGQSYLLPFAGTSCSGQGNAGGMRFSTDGGASWREYNTGQPMFGAFLLTPTKGWACGYNGSVYYTADGGQTWQLRNCGIDPTRHLDDLWFINDTLGWVVGQGVWRLAPPERRFETDTLSFPTVCIPGNAELTVRLENRSFNPVGVELRIEGADSAAFQLRGIPPAAVLQSCSWTPIVVRFAPSRAGSFAAVLVARFPDGMVRQVVLQGNAREADGFPLRDTVVVAPARCGVETRTTLPWRVRRDSVAIVQIDWIGGSGGIRHEARLPFPIPVAGAELPFVVLPTDTGWMEARFRVRLQPCARETVIVVRAYGVSPILNAPPQRIYALQCRLEQVDSIPVVNTGNDTLRIARYWLEQAPPGAVEVLGWASGAATPRALPPGHADTLLVWVRPLQEGAFRAVLWLENNDSTSTRGRRNPFAIELAGEARRTLVTAQQLSYDFGRVCVGTEQSVRVRLHNAGTLTALLSQPRVTPPFAAEVEDRRNPPVLLGGDTVGLRIRFAPSWEGVFADTVVLTVLPCGERVAIAVRGEGVRAALRLEPAVFQASSVVGRLDTAEGVLRNVGSARLRIAGYRWNPPLPSWVKLLEPVPGTWLEVGAALPLRLELRPDVEETYRGTLCVLADAECAAEFCVPVELRSRRVALVVEPARLHVLQYCTPVNRRVSLRIRNAGQELQELRLWVEPPLPEFQLVAPAEGRLQLSPGEAALVELQVGLDREGSVQAELVVETVTPVVERFSIPLQLEHYRSVLQADSVAEFGEVELCREPVRLGVVVQNVGSLADTVELWLQSASEAFAVVGSLLRELPGGALDTVIVELRPWKLPIGEERAQLRLRSRFCGQERWVQLSAIGVRGHALPEPAALDFGALFVGESAVRELQVWNPTVIALEVESAWIEPPGGGFVVEVPNLPQVLPPGARMPLRVRFDAAVVGDAQAWLRVALRSTCTDTLRVPLTARVQQELYTAQIWMERHVAAPGDTVQLPIWAAGIPARAGVEELQLEVWFDPQLLLPVGVYRDSALPFRFDGQGRLGVRLGQLVAEEPTVIAWIRGVALAGSPNETLLHLPQPRIAARKLVSSTTRDGWLRVEFCAIGRLGLRGSSALTLLHVGDELTLELFSAVTQPWRIRVLAADGRTSWEEHRWVGQGKRQQLSWRAPSSGVYAVLVEGLWSGERFQRVVPLVR